ncbi:20016_t:CDS:2, partial [Funneliformis geosporum]
SIILLINIETDEIDSDIAEFSETVKKASTDLVNQSVSITSLIKNGLDINFLIKEHERHDAYNSHPILCQTKTSSSQNITNKNTIQPNK